jgi:hypothetical protein
MAAMLRVVGVPARVAVGFTPGIQQPDGSYLVTTDQAHAWPEAWFSGVGWVRFEPTPASGFVPPGYTQAAAPQAASTPTTSASAAPSASASASAAAGESKEERQARLEAEQAAGGPSTGSTGGSGPAVWPLALGAGLLAVLALPGFLHLLRRRARWQRPDPAAAWDQVRDDALDVGLPLDPARSPRQARDALARQAVLSGPARQALDRLATAVELERYAPPGTLTDPAALAADAKAVRRGLHAPLSRRQRWRIALLPASTVRWSSGAAGGLLDRLALTRQGMWARLAFRRPAARRP